MSAGPSFSLELQPSTKMVNGVAYIRAVIALTDTNYTSFTNAGFSYFLVALTNVIDTNTNETNTTSTLLYNTTFQATDKSNITFELPYTYTNTDVYTVAVTAFYDTNAQPNRVTENHTYLTAPTANDYILLVGSAVDVDDTNDPKHGQLLATISIADSSDPTATSTSEYLVQAYTSDHTQFYNDTVLVQSGDYDVNLMENLIEGGIFLKDQYWYLTVTAITGGGSIVLYGDAANDQNDTSNTFTPIKISNEPNEMVLAITEPQVQKMQLTAQDVLPNDNYDITKIELTLTVTDPDTTDNGVYNLTYTGANLAATLDTVSNTYTFVFPDQTEYTGDNCGDDGSTLITLPQTSTLTVTLQATNTYNDSSSDTALDSHEYTGPLQSIGPTALTSNKIDADGLVVATQDSSGPKLELTASYLAESNSLDDISSLTLELTKNNDTTTTTTWTIDVTDTNVTQTHDSNVDTFTLVIENGLPVTGATDSTTTMALAGSDVISISLSATNQYGTGNPKTDFTYNGNNNETSVTIQDAITFTGNVTASSLASAITNKDILNGDYNIGVTLEDGIGTNGIEDILNLNGITNYQLVVSSFPDSDTVAFNEATAYASANGVVSANQLADEVDLEVGDTNSSKPNTATIQLTVVSIFDDSNSTETTLSAMSNAVTLTNNTLEIESHSVTQPEKSVTTVTGTITVPTSDANTTNFSSATVTLHMYPNNNTSATAIDLSDTSLNTKLQVPAVTVTQIDSSNNEVDYSIAIDSTVYPNLLGSRIKAVATIETNGSSGATDTSDAVDSAELIYLHDTPTLSYDGDRADTVVGNGSLTATVTPNGYTVSTVFAVDAADNTESLTVIAGGPDSNTSNLSNNNTYNTSFDSNETPSFDETIGVSNISDTDDYLLLVLTTSGTTDVNNNELVVSGGVTLN